MSRLSNVLFFLVFTYSAIAQNPYEDYKRHWKGRAMPEVSFKTLDNQIIHNGSLRGSVVLLNFWFIACPGCKSEYLGLQTLRSRFDDPEKVMFISITTDDKAMLKQFLRKNPLNFEHVASGEATGIEKFGILGYPTNIIVDQKGIVRHVKIGGSNQSADDIEYEMKLLLKNN